MNFFYQYILEIIKVFINFYEKKNLKKKVILSENDNVIIYREARMKCVYL